LHIDHIWLKDFRSYPSVDLELTSGVCAVLGPNGVGKSNLLEAVAYLALLESFRGAPTEAMIAEGSASAVVRATMRSEGREQLVEAELVRSGRNRVLVNRQRLNRTRDLAGAVRVTVFSPDDLALIKGGPGLRRGYLDHLMVAIDPRAETVRSEYDRALRQRNALLKQTRGRLDEAATITLEVWDSKIVSAGEELTRRRVELIDRIQPLVSTAYADVAGPVEPICLSYLASWADVGLAAALHAARADELRRGVTLVGPHRDDVLIELNQLPSRTHSSQGEQRSLALALRLAAHRLVHEVVGSPPVLILDDVFSELDPGRSAALLRSLPTGQTLLSTAAGLPEGISADQVVRVSPGEAVDGPPSADG